MYNDNVDIIFIVYIFYLPTRAYFISTTNIIGRNLKIYNILIYYISFYVVHKLIIHNNRYNIQNIRIPIDFTFKF